MADDLVVMRYQRPSHDSTGALSPGNGAFFIIHFHAAMALPMGDNNILLQLSLAHSLAHPLTCGALADAIISCSLNVVGHSTCTILHPRFACGSFRTFVGLQCPTHLIVPRYPSPSCHPRGLQRQSPFQIHSSSSPMFQRCKMASR